MFIKNPNSTFAKTYREAKLLTAKILLNVNFEEKAEDCAKLDSMNYLMNACKGRDNFNVNLAIQDARKIDKQIPEIIRAFKQAHNIS